MNAIRKPPPAASPEWKAFCHRLQELVARAQERRAAWLAKQGK
jgi:hypothetical protein